LRLHEDELSSLLNDAAKSNDNVSVVSPVGNVQLQWADSPDTVADAFLASHYGTAAPLNSTDCASGSRGDLAAIETQLDLNLAEGQLVS